MFLLEVAGIGIGYILTATFMFSLVLLYVIDFKFKMAKTSTYIYYMSLGVFALIAFLLILMFLGKFIISNLFSVEAQSTVYRFSVFGIMFGIVSFPFLAKIGQKIMYRV